MYLMTSSLVWHEPTFGIPCFKRLLAGKPCVPTIMHVGRQVASTAWAILKTDHPFKSPFPDSQAAKEELQRLQVRYKATRVKERNSMN
jgi:hypothetical protein